eukprot:TRINITY_DN27448_c0_g1_i1.p1 TRINITY_DN27448_c0_g1~~TRINITY_DN27448_c0_g1_i1.p1  ORF type:complete len:984 (-),score=175.77 TRINITY_DN27448_c0_g1_i1:70-3021(-)
MGANMSELQQQIADRRALERQTVEAQKEILAKLDTRTKIPHLLIELRSVGFIEICGKDIGGIYGKLDRWFKETFRCQDCTQCLVPTAQECCCGQGMEGLAVGPKEPQDEVCDKNYVVGNLLGDGTVSGAGVFLARGSEGENNMGRLTMLVINFMTNQCGWGLQLCDGGNLGREGQLREQQIKFKAPHPLNLMAPHLMIELRQVGYIEVNGTNSGGIYEKLAAWLQQNWAGRQVPADPNYCEAKFNVGCFSSRGSEGENNMGQRTMEIVDFMTKGCQWTLLTCNGGNFGRCGDKREQQMVFRNDAHVQHGENHLMVELRDIGYVEINGLHDAPDAAGILDQFYKQKGCQVYQPGFWESSTKFCDVKYQTPGNYYYRSGTTNNLGKLTIELATMMGLHGWMLLLANGGNVSDYRGYNIKREQQIKFTRARAGEKSDLPLLMIELRTVPQSHNGSFRGLIEVNGPNTNGIYEKLTSYLENTMLCSKAGPQAYCDYLYHCNCFRLKDHGSNWSDHRWDGKLNGESNFGRYTMRLCDFMVDHIGEWDLIVCNGNSVGTPFRIDKDNTVTVTGREQQLIFRYRPGGRNVFMAEQAEVTAIGRPPKQAPNYWQEQAKTGMAGQVIVPATEEEKGWLQELLDKTYKKKATRDRAVALADRFVVVSALRSEHPALWEKYAIRRGVVHEACKGKTDNFVSPKTREACQALTLRCSHPTIGNPSNEAYLFHGSNPTSAISILGTSFKVDFAGAAVGTMFGPGVYMAESSSKSDEYARDETGGTYEGLFAVLVCRVIVGSSFVVEKPGDYRDKCISGEYHSVVGDREKAVGTYREFIIFDEGSIYPEYVAFYRREYEGGAPPAPTRSSPAVSSAPGMHSMDPQEIEVVIPEDVMPGSKFIVDTPGGQKVELECPEGKMPGDKVKVRVPGATSVASSGGAPAPVTIGAAAKRQLQVRVPDGAQPGNMMEVDAPWGDKVRITLPAGITPGQVITVEV